MKVVGIFCGGFSSEFEISLKSAQTIQDHFPKNYQTESFLVSVQALGHLNVYGAAYKVNMRVLDLSQPSIDTLYQFAALRFPT